MLWAKCSAMTNAPLWERVWSVLGTRRGVCLELSQEIEWHRMRLEGETGARYGGAEEATINSECLLGAVKHHQTVLRRGWGALT